MFRIDLDTRSRRYCDGVSRRSFLQVGVSGLAGIGLGSLLRAQAASAETGTPRRDTSVILIWLDGGPSHMDLYDLKPDAPAEYRGIWSPIRTNVPGIEISELFPLQAKIADKFSLLRSLHHNTGDHFTAAHWMLTGRDGGVTGAATAGKYPFIGSMATRVVGARHPAMPPQVAIPYAMSVGLRPGYFGGNFLGNDLNPFETEGDPNSDSFSVRDVTISESVGIHRMANRRHLLGQIDRLRRSVDRSGTLAAMDRFDRDAYEMVSGQRARTAFDLTREHEATRARYGRHTWGQSALLARRLVEAGVTFVTCHLGGWDHHWDLKAGMENYLPRVDQMVHALLTDLSERGLDQQVMVVLCGEFSRTPRMNDGGNGGAPMSMGTPGRDHWGNAMSCLVAGGGLRGGQIVGSTDRLGEVPHDRPLRPGDLHHTIFHVLGIDPSIHFRDHAGRPIVAIDHGDVISELI